MIRFASLALVLFLAVAVLVTPTPAPADSGSISRDSFGLQVTRTQDPIGGPPTPTIFGIGQGTIFCAMVTLLIVAAVFGVYTFVTARPIDA